MQLADWVELLKKIPEDLQGSIGLGTRSSTEISVQAFLRLDKEFVLLRGRVGGTEDAGRILCLPYREVSYLVFSRQVSIETLRELFGEVRAIEKPPPTVIEEVPPEPSKPPVEPAVAPAKPEEPKLSLRDRLRARLAAGSSGNRSG